MADLVVANLIRLLDTDKYSRLSLRARVCACMCLCVHFCRNGTISLKEYLAVSLQKPEFLHRSVLRMFLLPPHSVALLSTVRTGDQTDPPRETSRRAHSASPHRPTVSCVASERRKGLRRCGPSALGTARECPRAKEVSARAVQPLFVRQSVRRRR